MHVHLREGETLSNVLPYTSSIFARGVVMGNLPEPIATASDVERYREEILSVAPDFSPIMSIMLTESTTPETLEKACRAGVKVLKFIPGNISTGSAKKLDLPHLRKLTPLLEKVRDLGMVFSCHFECGFHPNGAPIPKIHQENFAIRHAKHVADFVPDLKMVVEHVTTERMIDFIFWEAPDNIAATITAHHAILLYDDVCDKDDSVRNPLHYCKPVAKHEADRMKLRQMMTTGNRKFFFGSDTAPHPLWKKRGPNPAAGIFSAPVALPLLCQIFEEEDALENLEKFVSKNGADFYGLPRNQGTITLKKESWTVPEVLEGTTVFMGGKTLDWKVC